ncbi:autoinducer binding domain-containing protein [Methylobacterium sp. E-005]|uniref:autoinducer binding domain-containing protein n=1 Tax=Methylobacterium sp. E-005 TaxID=2836549 RepID=UPI00391B81DA
MSGLRQGVCVPVHRHDGKEACLSFSGSRPERSPGERAARHMIAIDAASSAKAITYLRGRIKPVTRSHVTMGAVECPNWSAAGKTAGDSLIVLARRGRKFPRSDRPRSWRTADRDQPRRRDAAPPVASSLRQA